jgi:uncharacterized iron-regulated protein
MFGAACTTVFAEDSPRITLWVDLVQGEPVAYGDLVADVAQARVVYLGERHTLARHHQTQAALVADLANRGLRLVLALEQLEAWQQPTLDKYNRGQLDFEQLAADTDWARRWHNYQQYRPVLEAARKYKAPVLALNAKPEIIRQVARGGGVSKLSAELRGQLPAEMQLHDADYEKLLNLEMAVHMAATPQRMRPMIEAQIARDEMMADVLARYLNSPEGRGRTAVVLCGEGHVSYALGTVARVRRRMPGVIDRIVLLSESGDVELSPEERAAARDVEITHEQLRAIGRPIGDYLQVRSLADRAAAER